MSELTRAQFAEKCGVVPKTIDRWANEGKVKKQPNGKFAEDDVEEFLAQWEGPQPNTVEDPVALQAKIIGQLMKHNERMFELLGKPLSKMSQAMERFTDSLSKRQNQAEANNLRMMRLVQKVMMADDERAEAAAARAQKGKLYEGAAELMQQVGPRLVDQVVDTISGGGTLKEFVKGLSEEERKVVWQLAGAFEGKQGERFQELLRRGGMQPPAKEDVDEPTETNQN